MINLSIFFHRQDSIIFAALMATQNELLVHTKNWRMC